jgi:hypothetical protein
MIQEGEKVRRARNAKGIVLLHTVLYYRKEQPDNHGFPLMRDDN